MQSGLSFTVTSGSDCGVRIDGPRFYNQDGNEVIRVPVVGTRHIMLTKEAAQRCVNDGLVDPGIMDAFKPITRTTLQYGDQADGLGVSR